MSLVQVTNIIVGNNPSSVLHPFKFDITFQCSNNLKEHLIGKLSMLDLQMTQILIRLQIALICLTQAMVQCNLPLSLMLQISLKFQWKRLLIGNTAIVISVSYEKQQFFRVGYYIRNQYQNAEMNENPPPKPIFNLLNRYIMSENPRISHFQIQWIKHQGIVVQDIEALQKNIQIMGGDPFLSTNGVFEQLDTIQNQRNFN